MEYSFEVDPNRHPAMTWVIERLGIPEGFTDRFEYIDHVYRLMDESDWEEIYVIDQFGNKVAYFTFCISQDIHRKGDILDITQVVTNPFVEHEGVARYMTALFKELAVYNECQWVSRCVHLPDGSIKNIYRRV